MTKLSIAIATYNEEKNIGRCLESVKWADEIIVVDESSTDKTRDIVNRFTNKLYKVPKKENFHVTKAIAIKRCAMDWVLVMDADEEVTKDLRSEIVETINSPTPLDGYQIPRRNKIFGKWFEHTGFYPDYQTRLFKRGMGYQPIDSFHSLIEVKGELGKLKHDILHYHYHSVEQFITRLNRYTTNDADFLLKKGEQVVWSDSIKFPADEFFKRFFYWEGYKDGLHGLILSMLQAMSRAVVFAKVWEKQGFFEENDPKFLTNVESQVKVVKNHWQHYLIKNTKNPAKKLGLKIKQKINL